CWMLVVGCSTTPTSPHPSPPFHGGEGAVPARRNSSTCTLTRLANPALTGFFTDIVFGRGLFYTASRLSFFDKFCARCSKKNFSRAGKHQTMPRLNRRKRREQRTSPGRNRRCCSAKFFGLWRFSRSVPPHPGPLPRGEGESHPDFHKEKRLRF